MNRRYYMFLILIFLLLLILYSIVDHKYRQYKIAEHIKSINELNLEIREYIKEAQETIKYKKSKSYQNKILKQDSLKNRWEIVVYLKEEEDFNKFVNATSEDTDGFSNIKNRSYDETYGMSVYQKWMWFLFNKDLR